MPRHSPAAQSVPATAGCLKRVVQGDSKSWEQYPLSLTPDVRHSLQALALCKMLVERGIDINHGDVAWSNLEVKLQGQWPSWNQVPTYVKGFDKIRLPTPGLNLSKKNKNNPYSTCLFSFKRQKPIFKMVSLHLRCGWQECRKCMKVERPSCCLSSWGDDLPQANLVLSNTLFPTAESFNL